MSTDPEPILTLEPFIDAVRDGVEGSGWALSGLQKTTSHEFAGRWEGKSTRSAYLFFHRTPESDTVAVEGFLDETTRGIQGSLSLVVDGPALDRLGDPHSALAAAGAAARRRLPHAHGLSVSLKLRLEGNGQADDATTELRIKVRVPPNPLRAGHAAVAEVAARAVRDFERLLEDPDLARYSESQ